uniref:CKLF-like MARVEL transmembrane domain containing 7 n=1 Tax=Kryptolebias marmoratus TaxID=37003 RepID=A0A3Q3A7D4_KRYMA
EQTEPNRTCTCNQLVSARDEFGSVSCGFDGRSCLCSGLLKQTLSYLLLVSCQVALLICFLCVHCTNGWPSWAAFQFFEVVALWFFVAFLIFFIMHLFRLQERMPCISWPLTEFFHYSVGAVLIFIASIVAAVKCGGVSALVVSSVRSPL